MPEIRQSITDHVLFTDVINPQSVGAATTVGVYVDMRDFDYVDFLISVGAVDAGGTVNAKARECDVSSAGAPSDIAAAAITPITDTGDNRLVVISVKKETMTKRYALVSITTAVSAAIFISALAVQYRKVGYEPVAQDTATKEVVKV